MTARKSEDEKLKKGPKPASKWVDIDNKLRELYLQDGITITRAAIIAGCDAKHASLQFKKFGEEIAEHVMAGDEDWLEKNDRVRARALEGLAVQVQSSDDKLGAMKLELKSAKELQANLIPNAMEKFMDTELYAAVQGAIEKMDTKTFFAIYSMMQGDINMWKNYGYYVQTIRNNIRAETQLNLEIQQQYDTIEIMPPASEIMDRIIERKIAEKQGLTQPVPVTEQQTIKSTAKSKPKTKRKTKK